MSYQMRTGRLWPEYLVRGEHPSRGREAKEENEEVQRLLDEGFEPFAVVPELPLESTQIWFRRKA